jgi:hypothetical protein
MNCGCLKFNEGRLIEYYKANGVVNPRVSAQFLGINLSTGDAVINLVYAVHGDNRPYNSQKGKVCNMIASFCPWCGKSTRTTAACAATPADSQKGEGDE